MKKTLEEKIKESVPTLVVFQHVGRQDAVAMKYLVESLRRHFNGTVEVIHVDTSYDGNLKVRYKLEEYPTWILFKEGQELMRESGSKTEPELIDMANRAL